MTNLDDIISKVATNSAEIAELKKTFQQGMFASKRCN